MPAAAEEDDCLDEPVGVTELSAPAPSLQRQQPHAPGPRRWISVDDVALLLAPPDHGAAEHGGAAPLAARLATHVDATDEHGWTLMMHAALRGLPAAVAALLEAGADAACESSVLKRCTHRDRTAEFRRGSTALSIANAALPDGSSEDSDPFLVVSMLRGPGRRAGVAAEQLDRRLGVASRTANGGEVAPAAEAPRRWDPMEDPPPLASACSWLPASALPAHYHQTSMQPSESTEDAARREYREALAEGAALRASGDFSAAVDGYKAAVRKYAGAPLRDDQYVAPEPQPAADSFAIQRQSWDVANQQRTIEWRIG
jgi:hypothetical protein